MLTEHTQEKRSSYLPMIIIIAILGLLTWILLYSFKGEGNGYMWAGETTLKEGHESHLGNMEEKAGYMVDDPAALGTLDTASGNFIYNTGAEKELLLPDSTKIKAGENSSEAKLISFLSSEAMKVDSADKTKGWISLDRLYFETGKAVITPESETQLKNISAILKAFPAAHVKIGGYTDSTGSEETNMKLSESRAKAAMASLVASGTAADRLSAEGYGKEHAIANNETAEGKALNRRIDVRVVKK